VSSHRITSWLEHAWDSEVTMVERFQGIVPKDVEFNTLVGTGLSGGLIVPVLARMLNVDFAIVRKEGVSNHGHYDVEGVIGDKWLFVDDLICTGASLRKVHRKMEDCSKNTQFMGVYLYDTRYFVSTKEAHVYYI
jgi:orotate phosphoribosyltransferase